MPEEFNSCLYQLAYRKLVPLLSPVTLIRRTYGRLTGFLEAECCHLLGCFSSSVFVSLVLRLTGGETFFHLTNPSVCSGWALRTQHWAGQAEPSLSWGPGQTALWAWAAPPVWLVLFVRANVTWSMYLWPGDEKLFLWGWVPGPLLFIISACSFVLRPFPTSRTKIPEWKTWL